jgi:hypothetical protein
MKEKKQQPSFEQPAFVHDTHFFHDTYTEPYYTQPVSYHTHHYGYVQDERGGIWPIILPFLFLTPFLYGKQKYAPYPYPAPYPSPYPYPTPYPSPYPYPAPYPYSPYYGAPREE